MLNGHVLRRVTPYLNQRGLIALAAGLALLALPTLSDASTGSATAAGSGGGGIGPSGQADTQSGNRTVTASASGITIATRASGFMNRNMHFTGTVGRSQAGKVVEIQRSGRHTGGQWVQTTHATIQSNGTFTASWNANRPGPLAIRALISNTAKSAAATSWPTVNVVVYRMAIATIYGPGFWGSQTACGQTLHRNTLGVAHRTLPCGTMVSIYYHGRTVEVPVIDRGPYANGADWDLTEATARALGMEETENVGGATISHPKS
jgi:rare lipoprotein A (peptidoglycan hydrolase)